MSDPDHKLAPGDSVTVELTDMAHGGEAVGRAEGTVVFAWGGISGETAEVDIERVKGNIAWGTVARVKNPSPHRVTPPCPYFGPCGGCQWQHIAYPAQADFKRDILAAQLRRVAGLPESEIDRLLLPTAAMEDPWAYRNVAHFQVDAATRRLGYFRRESRTVVPVEVCPISEPGINRLLPLLQELFAAHAEAPGDLPANISEIDLEAVRRGQMPVSLRERKATGGLQVWQVTVRVGGAGEDRERPETVVLLHTLSEGGAPNPRRARRNRRGQDEGEERRAAIAIPRRAIRRWVEGLDGPVTVVEARADGSLEMLGQTRPAGALDAEDAAELTFRGEKSGSRRATKAGDQDRPEQPPGVLRHRLAGQDYRVAPTAFFQVNTRQAERILELVSAALPERVELLVDAYSGAGTFAFALLNQDRAARVVAVESDWAAVESARWTAQLLGVDAGRLRLELGKVEDLLPGLDLQPDVVLLDPPRSGCSPRLLSYLVQKPVRRLIYVSCDPSTLARDVKLLAPAYRLVSAQPVDMFPQTYHIESISILEHKG